jgi:hypothetical protein
MIKKSEDYDCPLIGKSVEVTFYVQEHHKFGGVKDKEIYGGLDCDSKHICGIGEYQVLS